MVEGHICLVSTCGTRTSTVLFHSVERSKIQRPAGTLGTHIPCLSDLVSLFLVLS